MSLASCRHPLTAKEEETEPAVAEKQAAYNVHRLSAVLVFCVNSAWNRSRLELQNISFIQQFNSNPSEGYVADDRNCADVFSIRQHSRKPLLAVVLVRLLQFKCVNRWRIIVTKFFLTFQ